jgi:transcriptional regulator with XRE-family HTH domain
MQNLQDIVYRIQDICFVKDISVNKLLVESGAGSSLVANMKKGQYPTIKKFSMLADYLGCSIDELLGREVLPQSPQERALEAYLALSVNERKAFIQEAVKHI